MVDKNEKKEDAKRRRNMWTMSPVTRVAPNRGEYNRFQFRKNKKVYEDDLMASEGEFEEEEE